MKYITKEEINKLRKGRQERLEKMKYISLRNYTHILKNYEDYKDFLSENMVMINNTDRFCFKNTDERADFSKTINDSDLQLDLMDAGYKVGSRDFKRLTRSDRMEKIDAPFEIIEKLCY